MWVLVVFLLLAAFGSLIQNEIPVDNSNRGRLFRVAPILENSMVNTLKSLMRREQPAIGSWIGFADPYSVELMADVRVPGC